MVQLHRQAAEALAATTQVISFLHITHLEIRKPLMDHQLETQQALRYTKNLSTS